MPPVPHTKPGCSTGEEVCKLAFWKARDACTSETLEPAVAYSQPACKAAMHSATQRCETVLVACGAGATLQRLEKQILPADMTHIEGDTAHPQAPSPAQHAAKDL